MRIQLRIRERDGEFQVEELRDGIKIGEKTEKVKVGSCFGIPEYERRVKTVYGDPRWECALFMDGEGNVIELGTVEKTLTWLGSFSHAIFESKEHAIDWIEHFWGQQYSLEPPEWRTV